MVGLLFFVYICLATGLIHNHHRKPANLAQMEEFVVFHQSLGFLNVSRPAPVLAIIRWVLHSSYQSTVRAPLLFVMQYKGAFS